MKTFVQTFRSSHPPGAGPEGRHDEEDGGRDGEQPTQVCSDAPPTGLTVPGLHDRETGEWWSRYINRTYCTRTT